MEPEIDEPMTRALKDRIINREQEKLDGYVSMGALLDPCDPVPREREQHHRRDEWRLPLGHRRHPDPPLKSASVYVAYTDAGFSVYYEGGDE